MYYEEKTMKSERVYEGKILNLRVDTVELPNRKYSKREIVEHGSSVVIIPIMDDNSVLMVKQYRKAIDKVVLEFPAGLVESGEDPKEAALRELQEEVGYTANKIEYIYDFYTSPGFTDERINVFVASDLIPSDMVCDEDEFLEIVKIDLNELIEKLHNYELFDAKAIIGAQYLEILRNKNESK
ncbi:NUDIX hydrolase [Microaceticoccus formicicus]|uniref:NUDIX hydrolase n=1 Tax=Microaceticoccus formicicus TaxID=3118105 RepID=UPI003CD00455|nr:NUDIX hydrolase [Peptoniphilaceae bacterium AMB_02]